MNPSHHCDGEWYSNKGGAYGLPLCHLPHHTCVNQNLYPCCLPSPSQQCLSPSLSLPTSYSPLPFPLPSHTQCSSSDSGPGHGAQGARPQPNSSDGNRHLWLWALVKARTEAPLPLLQSPLHSPGPHTAHSASVPSGLHTALSLQHFPLHHMTNPAVARQLWQWQLQYSNPR